MSRSCSVTMTGSLLAGSRCAGCATARCRMNIFSNRQIPKCPKTDHVILPGTAPWTARLWTGSRIRAGAGGHLDFSKKFKLEQVSKEEDLRWSRRRAKGEQGSGGRLDEMRTLLKGKLTSIPPVDRNNPWSLYRCMRFEEWGGRYCSDCWVIIRHQNCICAAYSSHWINVLGEKKSTMTLLWVLWVINVGC